MSTKDDQTKPDQVDDGEEVDLDDDGDFEIEVADDVPAADKPRLSEDHKPDLPSDDEIESYSESVQKRIKKLKFEAHEAERQRQAALRERDEAVNFAKTQNDTVAQLRQQLTAGQSATMEQAKGRFTAELEQAKRDYRAAYEAGDTDALLDAQQRLNKAQVDLSRVESWRPPAQQETPKQQAPQPTQQPAPQPQATERQKKWGADNPWFGADPEMTGTAYGVHERLVRSGVDTNSETYYTAIDEAMRKRYPDYFDDGSTEEVSRPTSKSAPAVAPATRSSKNPRKYVMTPSQVAIAKRLGLSNKQYVAQLMKDAKNG